MTRYIDVDNAIRQLRGRCVAKYPSSFYCGILTSADEIDKLPTADVVEVVRCKDCKYYNPNYSRFESDTPYNRCEHPAQQFDVECYDMWLETNLDDFCSYGTPKERGGEK